MEMSKNITIIFLLAVVLHASAVTAKPVNVLLQEGLYAEEVDGDLDAAIRSYEQVINDTSAQRSQVAQALYRQGMCYLKLKDEQRARLVFAKLVEDYNDQTKIVDKIKPMLDELNNTDPAALMPPETLVYVELGSLGKQIETILNMLKDTPFANPLAAIGGGTQPRGPGGKSPADMMAALMNPSMMAEFKKLRGMAIGVTGISHNNPPMIAVMYPGKSDALRGLIVAGLGMIAQPGEAIEGMSTLVIENVAGIAYDEKVIIIAQPLKQLTWCVRQYKGLSNEPTLSSSDKSFLKVSKKARQENALTIWSNADEVFAGVLKMFPEGDIPDKIRFIDSIVDIKNIDDFIASFSIKENGIALEANTAFKDGHNCLAYNLIRTPEISRAGLEAVPSEAVGLLSLALGEADGTQAEAIGKKIENLTGLDIGREIFANIEQVTLFAMPIDVAPNQEDTGLPPIAHCVGLAITSQSPQQTHNLLNKLLSVANLVTGQSGAEQSKQGIKKYQVGLINNRPCYCYMNQINKTTILSLNSDIVEKSVSAVKNRRSVFTAGPLKEAASNLSETTNKLVLINVGGAIRHVDSCLKATHSNPHNPAHKLLAQLAQVCDDTSIRYRTYERANNIDEYYSIDKLPPMDKFLPLLMQLSQVDPTAKAKATGPEPSNGATLSITAISQLKWKRGVNAKSHKVYFGTEIDELALLVDLQNANETKLPELQEGMKYYWRVDEIWGDGTVITGDVWNFSIGKLVAWWKFDESGGSSAGDSSGNNHTGTLVGDPQWRPSGGRIGGALEFDGEGDYVRIEDESSFDITNQITVSAWVNISSVPTVWTAIVTKGDSAWRLSTEEAEQRFHFAVSRSMWVNGRKSVEANEWHHVLGVYDGEQIRTYVDGEFDASMQWNGRIESNDYPVYIGENAEQTGRYWNGLIDDVRVYSYALSDEEIGKLCRAKAMKPKPSDGAVVNPAVKVELSWDPAVGTHSHKVYLGLSKGDLRLAGETKESIFTTLPNLQKDKKYSWRVDGILNNGSVAKGDVWSFSAGKLVGWWKFDESSGSIAGDSSGNGNNGTLQGDVAWQPKAGKFAGALKFDGTSSYVEIPTEGMSALMGTVSLWVKLSPQQKEPEHRYIFGHTTTPYYSNRIQLYMDESLTMLDLGLCNSHNLNTNMATLEVETWYQIALAWNEGVYVVYLNGEELASGGYNNLEGLSDIADIGNNGRPNSRNQSFNGLIDDVRIYNYALSKNGIKTLYNESK